MPFCLVPRLRVSSAQVCPPRIRASDRRKQTVLRVGTGIAMGVMKFSTHVPRAMPSLPLWCCWNQTWEGES